jgi:hypothetical protein
MGYKRRVKTIFAKIFVELKNTATHAQNTPDAQQKNKKTLRNAWNLKIKALFLRKYNTLTNNIKSHYH